MHEIVGHAVPIINEKRDGNAIDNENVVRGEIKQALRFSEPNHKESDL